MLQCDVVDVPRYLIDVPSSIRSAKALCHILGIMDGWPLQGPHSFNLTSGLHCHLASHLGSGLFSGRDDYNSLHFKHKKCDRDYDQIIQGPRWMSHHRMCVDR